MKSLIVSVTCLSLVFCLAFIEYPLSGQSSAQNGEIDWVKLNAEFAGAEYVRDKELCLSCHEEAMDAFAATVHSRLSSYGKSSGLDAGDCESCHGPRSKHIDDPDERLALSVEQYSAVCLQCHQDAERIYWHNSLHKTSEVGCTSCHTVMEKRSQVALLSKSNETEVCADCHSNVAAKMKRPSRHPIAEGKLECSSCHNPHGTADRSMLVKGGGNETCYSCHQDKRGPFLWEHPPAREDCLTCHEPHGSNNRYLLTTLSSTLCVSCHQYGGHINQYRYNRVSTPYGDGCANCHMTLHGSNHPSGAKFNR